MSIRDRILGSWGLVSFECTLPNGRVLFPFGRDARGHIGYTGDGLVFANLARENPARPEPGTALHRLGDQAAASLARGFMAYSGRFEIDEARSVARHHFDMCLDPALIGTLQERHIRFPGDGLLELSVREPAGVDFPSTLLWKKL